MDKLIARATDSINKILESPSEGFLDHNESDLVDIRNLLNRLLEPNMPTNDWTLLFYRQLNRLMDYNQSLTNDFWNEFHDDILYVLEGPNVERSKGKTWYRFLQRMELERKLKQRELHFNQTKREQKNLHRLFCEHEKFFEEYLQKCISLHSKVEVKGLIENIDDLLCRNYGLTEVSVTSENRKRLKEKLNCIDITIDCSNRSLQSLDLPYSTYHDLPNKVNQSLNSFLPSLEQIETNRNVASQKIGHLLRYDRWIVILGDPGSAKTTLLRWITRIFAETALFSHGKVGLEENHHPSVRIPILIRIGEFAAWLEQHETETLMDYIGEHTWFAERYCHDDNKKVLKELVYYGHALILLDGLDEIPEVGRRSEIVDLVRKFIDEYLRAPDFISAFDDKAFECMWSDNSFVETQSLSKFGGNQIVVTSRIIGYQFHPLKGSFIKHYSLVLLNHNEAKKFVKKWMLQVEKCIFDDLLNEGFKLGGETVEILSKKRDNAVEAMFDNSSQLLLSNPSLLSLICAFIFQLPDEFHPKSRIEVYNYAVQAAFRFWRNQESTISESVLTHFLIDLANYLHLNSPSGLIDAFDMEQLCRLSLKQKNVSDYRVKLRKYADKLISFLESNNGIATERGLQVFGFLHLSFQEYFVAQSFVRGSSIEDIVNRILSFTINPRFRESLSLALGWISWKWSLDDYETFCSRLLNPTKNYKIPFGTLLLFDAYNDLQRLPSNTIIFTALNNLLDHPSNVITKRYLIPNLSKLDEYIIVEWMQLRLKDEKCLFKFCQSFPTKHEIYYDIAGPVTISIPPVIYQQLWLLHNRSSSAEFIIDQTLRTIMTSDDIPDQIFNKDFSLYFLSHNICVFNVHPLILSVIIAVCGGVRLKKEKDIINIQFSLKQTHRESSILAPIVKYFDNNEELDAIKIQTLIKYYQNFLQNFLPSDTSIDIVDTFIALICLQSVSKPLSYQKYNGYKALPLALERLKWTWFYFKELSASNLFYSDMSLIQSEIKSSMDVFFSKPDQSDEQQISFSVAYAASLKKLGLWNLPKWLNRDIRKNELTKYFHSQSKFIHLITVEKLDEIAKIIHSLEILQQKRSILLNFLPQSLQSLYWYTTIASNNNTDSLPLVVFLSQCLTHLEDIDHDDLNSYLTLPVLLPMLKEHMFENYALVLWEKHYNTTFKDAMHKEFLEAMQDHKLLDIFPRKKAKDWEIYISVERQRICEVKNEMESQKKDVKLFAASISLVRLFQARYHSDQNQDKRNVSVSTAEREELHDAIRNIFDPNLRVIALSVILDIKDSLIFDEEQENKLQCEMISTLQSLLPDLSLLKSTLLFIRCYTAHKHFPVPFHYMANVIGEKLNKSFIDKQNQEQEAAYMALRQLNNSDLSPYLSEFAKRTKNLPDLLQFNSTTFFCYFTNRTSSDPSNSILLSSMYLAELAFDAQILNMYVTNNHKNNIPLQTKLKELWNDSSKIMTFKAASWITNTLQISNKEELFQIIDDVSHCSAIERNALSVIEKWLSYRTDKDLRFFAHYAALQLIIQGSEISDLIDIINEMFIIDNEFHLKSLVECIFLSPFVDLIVVRQILIILQRNVRHASKISVWIDRKEIFEVILKLELEQVTSHVHRLPDTSTKPFLLMISGCSKDLQVYLAEHLRTSINKQIEIQCTIEEKYIAIVVKWIIENWIWCETTENLAMELYKSIFALLHDQRFPLIQKAIVNGLNSLFTKYSTKKENFFLEDDSLINLEKVISLWNAYPEDVVAVCLLAYGNCLLKLQILEMHRKISDEVKNVLNILFETSSSEIISIRAALCLIFVEHSDIEFSTISNWFEDRPSITSDKRYNIFLQQFLYEVQDQSFFAWDVDIEICEFLEMGSTEFIERLVIVLYNYLCNNDNSNYLSDPTPDYVEIAMDVSEVKCKEFCNAVQKSSFGEKEFKSKLTLHYKNNPRHSRASINLYAAFGMVTVDLVDMVERFGDYSSLDCLRGLKQVSDQAVTEKLFQLLDLTTSKKKFERLFSTLQSLVRANAISLLEVHQRVSLTTRMLYSEFDPDEWRNTEDVIFEGLLDLSCFKNERSSGLEKRIFTKCDIDEMFERQIENFDKNCALFSTKNNLLSHLRQVSNSLI